VAHPDLVPVAREIFDRFMGLRPHQKNELRADVQVGAADLLAADATPGRITEGGVRTNISVALQYLHHWLKGAGAVAINNLMEDAATAEISRAQLWQWIHHGCATDAGLPVTAELYRRMRSEERSRLESAAPGAYADASELLDEMVLAPEFSEFLTLPGYRRLVTKGAST
jgi:malate synthase